MLMELEQMKGINLLAVRSVQSFAEWLELTLHTHPVLEEISL
jgi:hypothetical protein